MILQSLNALYERLAEDPEYEVAPAGYSLQKITFKVVLRPDGRLFTIEDARERTGGALRPRQLRVLGTTKPPGSGVNPCFLWDNSGYMLGFKVDDEKPERTRQTFEAFRSLHLSREQEIDVPQYSAVCRFLENWDPAGASTFPVLLDAASTGFGVFQIIGETRYVHEHPRIDQWWQDQAGATDEPEVLGQCLVTGVTAPLARTHGRIRGVAGAQGAGAAIVGFNEPAYESYGKHQSFNAPVSESAAFRYVTALNALLDGPKRNRHRIRLGDATVVFWTDKPTQFEDVFLPFVLQGSEDAERGEPQDEAQRLRMQALLEAVRQGRASDHLAPGPNGTAVYVLGLSPNAARISVRFFHNSSVAELVRLVHRHHQDIGLLRGNRDPEFPSLLLLLEQTARERKDIPPLLEGPFLRAILTGAPYPHALYAAVMRRIRADRTVDYLRCCVIKGYLTRNLNLEMSMALDSERLDPAYRLGRLFAALEKTQRDALGDRLNRTVRDSFYSSASATPRNVFPRLLRTYQHHLEKLDGGLRVHRERLVQDILAPLEQFPAHLSLAEQGLFAIGYYHQSADFYTKRNDPSRG